MLPSMHCNKCDMDAGVIKLGAPFSGGVHDAAMNKHAVTQVVYLFPMLFTTFPIIFGNNILECNGTKEKPSCDGLPPVFDANQAIQD